MMVCRPLIVLLPTADRSLSSGLRCTTTLRGTVSVWSPSLRRAEVRASPSPFACLDRAATSYQESLYTSYPAWEPSPSSLHPFNFSLLLLAT